MTCVDCTHRNADLYLGDVFRHACLCHGALVQRVTTLLSAGWGGHQRGTAGCRPHALGLTGRGGEDVVGRGVDWGGRGGIGGWGWGQVVADTVAGCGFTDLRAESVLEVAATANLFRH